MISTIQFPQTEKERNTTLNQASTSPDLPIGEQEGLMVSSKRSANNTQTKTKADGTSSAERDTGLRMEERTKEGKRMAMMPFKGKGREGIRLAES